MGCCPSKCPVASPRKEYAAETEASLLEPSLINSHQEEPRVDDGVQEMLMDRGDGTSVDMFYEEEPAAEAEHGDSAPESLKLQPQQCVSKDHSAVLLRRPEPAPSTVQSPPSPPPSPPRKSSRSADEIPISSTYHRVHSAVVEEQDVKRKEELRLEAEQRAREVREYKAALQLA